MASSMARSLVNAAASSSTVAAAAACARARALADAVTASYWAPEDDDAWHAARVKRPEEASQIATVEEEAAALTKLRAMLDAIEPPRPLSPSPPGSRAYTLPPLAAAEEAIVNDALGHGPSGEMLADYKNIPITRKDMATLAPHEWLNDEVINYFFTLLETREAEAVEAARAGCTDNVTLAWPRCHFHQTNFYTKLIGGGGYTYKSVSRWTKKVDVFSKDLIIVPIHVHGNHWTLAVINFKERRFEYYDSLRGSAESILTNLRRWLEDESLDKKKVPYDTSEWTEVVWKAKTPTQRNGFDCGVFMTRTADWLARDAVLSFTQEDMEHFRRIHVLEIMQEALMPP